MTAHVPERFPSLATIQDSMEKMEAEVVDALMNAQGKKGLLPANPIVNAFQEIWEAVRTATNVVILNGKEALEEAMNTALREWERWRSELGDQAGKLLDYLSEKLSELVRNLLTAALQQFPLSLSLPNWENEIGTMSAEFNINVTPTFEVALYRWLTIACAGGLKVTVTYTRRAS
jgi:hypothetical protein